LVFLHYLVKQETQKLCLFTKIMYAVLSTDTQTTLKYYLVTVTPSFSVKMINIMHQTGPTGRKLKRLDMSPTCSTITMSVTVSVVVSKWELFFTKPGVKTNRQLLSQQILDTIKRVIDGSCIFQQDGALMFIAFNTVQLLWCKTPISLSFWAIYPKRSELNSSNDEI